MPLPPIPEDTPAKPVFADEDSSVGADEAAPAAPTDPIPVSGPPPHRRRRGILIAALVLVALGVIALIGSFFWVRSQYFVGASDGQVVVYRGVDGSVLGIRLSSVQESSCEPGLNGCSPLLVDDLRPAARQQVLAGIQAGTLDDARSVVDRLAGQMLPECPPPPTSTSAAPSTSATATTASAGPTGSALAESTHPPSPLRPRRAPSGRCRDDTAAHRGRPSRTTAGRGRAAGHRRHRHDRRDRICRRERSAATGGTATPSGTSTGTPLSSRTPEPGVTCRPAK